MLFDSSLPLHPPSLKLRWPKQEVIRVYHALRSVPCAFPSRSHSHFALHSFSGGGLSLFLVDPPGLPDTPSFLRAIGTGFSPSLPLLHTPDEKTPKCGVFLLTHLGSNQDFSEPKSDVLPITPWVSNTLTMLQK